MIRRHKGKLLVSTGLILLPILFGLLFWNQLPEQMTTHWGLDGTADGWSGRGFAVFGLPLILLAGHWLCVFVTAKDPKNREQSGKVFGLVLWIFPVVSLLVCGMMYAVSFGKNFPYASILMALIGLMFVMIGNYLPKCRQNHTIGIKVKWTLENEENWNATHRMAGRVWVIGGLLMTGCVCLPETAILWVMPPVILVLAGLPMAYSYWYHKKQVREGTAVITPVFSGKENRKIKMISLISVAAVLIFAAVIMFTGEIRVHYGADSFTIEADYWQDLTVDYAVIEQIEYRDSDSIGMRTGGLGSARLLAGAFHNEEFGSYTRYTYTGCRACVVLTGGDKVLVLNGPDAKSTKELYEQLNARIG